MQSQTDSLDTTSVQPGDVITAALMNSVLARLDELDRRAMDVRLVPTPLLAGSHTVVALGGAYGQPGGIWINDSPLLPAIPNPGINVAILAPNMTVKYWSVYATGALTAESQRLVNDLQTYAGSADLIVAITQDAFADQLQPVARDALAAVGGAAFRTATPRDAIAFIGVIPVTSTLAFNYLVSDVPIDGQGAGLPFVWAVYSAPLRRFLVGGGTGGGGLGAAAAASISGLRFEPPSPTAGASTNATLTLSAPAPIDLTVTLSTGNSLIAQLSQTSVQIPQGQNSATFSIAAVSAGQVSISASLPNQPPFSASLTVQPPPPTLSVVQVTLSPNPSSVGATVTGTVVLSAAAPANTTVALSSGNTQVATLPQATVSPTTGQTSATFQVNAVSPGTTDIRAALGASAQIATMTVQKPKDTKEKEKEGKDRKETKEKEKEGKDTKELAKEREKVQVEKLQREKATDTKLRDAIALAPADGAAHMAAVPAADGHAFIRPAERPAVGQAAAQGQAADPV
jgi:hypothetical protein